MPNNTTSPNVNQYDNIPMELKDLPQWVGFAIEIFKGKDGKNEKRKVPKNPKTGGNAMVNKPETWGTFEEACNGRKIHKYQHIGFAFTKDDPYCGIDIDDCVGPNKTLSYIAQEILTPFMGTYSEFSASGNGIHIISKGKTPQQGRKIPELKVELYDASRFFVFTGNPLYKNSILELQEEINSLYEKHFKEKTSPVTLNVQPQRPELIMSDDEIIEKAKGARNGGKFSALYNGDTSGNADDKSSADFALCGILAFWTRDPDQIDRIFRNSKLFRPKWDSKRGNLTYGAGTVQRALNAQTTVYDPSKGKRQESNKKPKKEDTPMNQTLTEEVKKQEYSTSVEEPIRFWEEEGMTYQKFPVDMLPPILKHASQEITRVVKVPIEMSSGAVISARAASFHNNVIVVEKNKLEHFITFLMMVVAESSERKSNTFKRAMSPLIIHTRERKEEYERKLISCKGMGKVIEKQIREITNTISKNISETEANKCAQEIAKLEEKLKAYEPEPYQFYTTDTTEQAFVRCLEKNNGCFSLLTEEGGDIIDYISGSKSNNSKTNDSVFLKLITGDSIGRERIGSEGKGESVFIEKPCGNILVMIQPNRFHEFMSNPALRDCGLISRVSPILAHENSMVGRRLELNEDAQLETDIDADMREYEELLSTWLKNKKRVRVTLSKNATFARAQYHDEIEKKLGRGGELSDVADIAGKSTSFATKLAAHFHLSKDENLDILNCDKPIIETQIPEETFLEASIMQKYFLGQAVNTQRTTDNQKKLNKAKDVLDWIIHKTKQNELDVFSLADIYLKYGRRPKLSSEETQIIVQLLVKNGWVTSVPGGKERYQLRKSAATEGF